MGDDGYRYKPVQEFLWFLLVAVLPVLLDALVKFDPNEITRWDTWAISIAAACVRAVGAAGLVALGKGSLARPKGGSDS